MKTLIRWALVLALIGAVAALVVTRRAPSTVPDHAAVQTWQLSPLERQRKISEDALARLEQVAAPYDRADFGPGMRSMAYRSGANVQEAYSAPDGTLYVITMQTEPPVSMTDLFSMATLDRGKIRRIPMPPVGRHQHGYSSIGPFFIGKDPSGPIVNASDFEGHRFYFAASPTGVHRTTAPSGQGYDTFTLSTGEDCEPDSSVKSPVAVWAVNGTGRRRPLVMKSILYRGSHDLIDNQTLRFNTVRCSHIGNLDLLNIGSRTEGVVFSVRGGKLALITRGEVLTSGAQHILVFREENDIGGGFDREHQDTGVRSDLTDYLEVFTRESAL
jgi:hypothetical protein